ncbi:hypothetical protein [Sphingomonas sp.]|uniref:hypothetical protein n=1 Tax=Sphingomonas sp. TaxID=28214 RepID=UPI003CC5AAF6
MAITNARCGLQRRTPPRWTAKARAVFLDELANSCNVKRSAAAAGLTVRGARELKNRDPEFAALWERALAEGTERLHEELIAIQLGQVQSEDHPGDERTERTPAPFDAELAMKTLKLQADLSRTLPRRYVAACVATPEEIDEALMKRLNTLAAKLGTS